MEKILLGCPQYFLKEYCFQEWIDATRSYTYPAKDVLVVDNSPDLQFMDRWKGKIPMVHLDCDNQNMNQRIASSMEYLRGVFLQGDYAWYLNLESDVTGPPQLIEYLLSLVEQENGCDWLNHAYVGRQSPQEQEEHPSWIVGGVGCSLFSRKILEAFDWGGAPLDRTCDGWMWQRVFPMKETYKVVHTYGSIKLNHLDSPDYKRPW